MKASTKNTSRSKESASTNALPTDREGMKEHMRRHLSKEKEKLHAAKDGGTQGQGGTQGRGGTQGLGGTQGRGDTPGPGKGAHSHVDASDREAEGKKEEPFGANKNIHTLGCYKNSKRSIKKKGNFHCFES